MNVGEKQDFEVDTEDAGGKGDLNVAVVGPSKRKIPVQMRKTPHGQKCSFTPDEEGPYRIDVEYDDVPVKNSPFMAEALIPPDPSKVRAFGPGLSEGVVNENAPFTIDTTEAGNGGLGLTVEGPCEAKIECIDNGDGTCSVGYLPTEPGDYKINILFADEHIPGSPFTGMLLLSNKLDVLFLVYFFNFSQDRNSM